MIGVVDLGSGRIARRQHCNEPAVHADLLSAAIEATGDPFRRLPPGEFFTGSFCRSHQLVTSKLK